MWEEEFFLQAGSRKESQEGKSEMTSLISIFKFLFDLFDHMAYLELFRHCPEKYVKKGDSYEI